jgi:long-chain acyl-CoA synthetase
MSHADRDRENPMASSIKALRRVTADETYMGSAGDAGTVCSALLANAESHPDVPAFVFRSGDVWTAWTWRDTGRIAMAVARMLRDAGLEENDAVVLDAPNGPAWLALDLGTQMAGAFTIPLYAGSPPAAMESSLAAIDANIHPTLLFTHRPGVVEAFETRPDTVQPATLDHVLALVRGEVNVAIRPRGARHPVGSEVACAVYVRPRVSDDDGGRVLALSQAHIREQCASLGRAFDNHGLADTDGDLERSDARLSVMPWAHIVERIQSVYLGIVAGVPTFVPCDSRDLLFDFRDAQPTHFSASNHLYNHLRQRLIDAIGERFRDAIDLARAFDDLETKSALQLIGRSIPSDLAKECNRWRDELDPVVQGLLGGRLRLLSSASRLFDADTVLFYEAVGYRIYRSYGGNWLGGLVSTNAPDDWKVDTFGREVAPYTIWADDDEHLAVEAASVWPLSENEQAERDASVIPTADVAQLQDGWLRILGADEEVVQRRISLQGLNLTPTKEESYLMNDPLVDQAVAVERSMLIVPDREALLDWVRRWGVGSGEPLEREPEVVERFQVLTDLDVALQPSREALGLNAPAADAWSHVDEIDVAISELQSMAEAVARVPAEEALVEEQEPVWSGFPAAQPEPARKRRLNFRLRRAPADADDRIQLDQAAAAAAEPTRADDPEPDGAS